MLAQANRGQKATSFPIVAPVGGLNTRDALAAMPPEDASLMSNLFPYADRVAIRPGYTTLATASSITKSGTTEGFARLMLHVGKGTETAFGAFVYSEDVAGTGYRRLKIYSIASNGTLTSSRDVVTLASTDVLAAVGEWTQFTSAAGTSYMILMATIATAVPVYTNTPQAYDGASWSAPTITGLPEFTLGVHSHRNRLWFYGCDSINGTPKPLSAYYLPTGAIAGAVTEFNLGPFAKRGGTIVSMRTWTMDNGEGGTDDMAVFVTDQGEILIYQGTDPASAATWRLVGTFFVGKLASWSATDYRSAAPLVTTGTFVKDSFAMKYGNDVIVMTQGGPVSVAKVLQGGRDITDYSLSDKIRPTFNAIALLVTSFPAFVPWKMTYLPALQHFIIHTPSGYVQGGGTTAISTTLYVMNSSTGAWTSYSGPTATDSIVVNGAMYSISAASSNGSRVISKMDGSALTDAGSDITFECRQAYNYCQSPNNKLATLGQPVMAGSFSMTFELDADFSAGTITTYTAYSSTPGWLSVNKYGRAFAPHLKGTSNTGTLSWYATNLVIRNAGLI